MTIKNGKICRKNKNNKQNKVKIYGFIKRIYFLILKPFNLLEEEEEEKKENYYNNKIVLINEHAAVVRAGCLNEWICQSLKPHTFNDHTMTTFNMFNNMQQ